MTSPAGQQPRAFRPDIEGMRALAVLMVLLYHAGVPWVPGGFAGVDVFFVISGYLITGLLIAEARGTGGIDLPRFWARRARRLLPASALVLVTTALLTMLVVPVTRWREIGWDILTSAAYVVNWRLAARSVDYLAEDSAPSPVQHYWSLAVEEQFYLVWPLLILLAIAVAKRRGGRLGVAAMVVLGLVVVLPSFAWSVHLTGTEPAAAYFVSTTRLWQLGVGALLSVAAARLRRLPPITSAVLAWAGLDLVILGALAQGAGTPWPGAAGLVPTLGTAAMIAGGAADRQAGWGPSWILALPPLQWVGALSYSLYLWHWPLLVLAAVAWGEPLGVWSGLAVVGLSALPAYLGYRFVEEPVRHHRLLAAFPARALAAGLACTLAGVLAGGALVVQVESQVQQSRSDSAQGSGPAGAGALEGGNEGEGGSEGEATAVLSPDQLDAGIDLGELDPATAGAPGPEIVPLDPDPARITPDPLEAAQDVPSLYERRKTCDGEEAKKVVRCDFGDPEGELTVALVGDSKIAQWTDAVDRIGKDRGWRVQLYYRSSCPWTAADVPNDSKARRASCRSWGDDVQQALTDAKTRPDVVLVSSIYGDALTADGSRKVSAMVEGLQQRWSTLGEAGVPVVAVADSPQPAMTVYECVAEHRDDLTKCTFPVNDGGGSRALEAAANDIPTSTFVTMNDWICPAEDECPPVVGEVLVYRQGSHITNTYALSLVEVLEGRLDAAFARVGVAQR